MRLVFAGTPEPAVPTLKALVDSDHEVAAVVTRTDARRGRGRKVSRSPVGLFAESQGIPLLQPDRPSDPAFLATLREFDPDVCPVVAYGALLPSAALEVPKVGWVNLHFSLLPAWRGAAPVQHAIWHGDDITGASTFLIEEGLDTGPVFGHVTETIADTDTSDDLLARLAESGAGLMLATLDGIANNTISAVPQPVDGVTVAPKIEVDDACIQWSNPAVAVDRQIRACTSLPGAWTTLGDQRVKVFPVESVRSVPGEPRLGPGTLLQIDKQHWAVGTATEPLILADVQPQGKKRMRAADWLRGLRLEPGVAFG